MKELAPYIERYYPTWFSYARYICTQFGIRNEAEDVVEDVIETFCRKSDAFLEDLLRHEESGNPKLQYFVKYCIRSRAIDTLKKNRRMISTDDVVISVSPDDDAPDHPQFDRMRELTAPLREDSFITTIPTLLPAKIVGNISQIITGVYVAYCAAIPRGAQRPLRKQCTTRHVAFEWLVQMSNQRVNG